ncbi:MAG: UvrD-helicase domain-containing protein [Verrucomicrobia bacterium]|nr:UvrD-helicase domain-containing protein [Verrucomicrobiota bacterium]
MSALPNEIIRASAGTGKTFALVRRYLWLLANGAEPERIAAMTFTRKAAGEFFERILQRLAEIAEHPESAKGYVDGLTGPGALLLLRKMVRRMDRLRLGTIDSFFAAMAQCLPFELGLTGHASLMGEDEGSQAREDVLDEMLLAVTRMKDKDELDELRESWKDASHGSEQNKPAETLLKWIGKLHNLFMECSDRDRWGGEDIIWSQGNEKFKHADGDMGSGIAKLEGKLDMSAFDKRAPAKWTEFFELVPSRNDADKIAKTVIEYMLKDERRGHDQLREGGAEWLMWKATMLDQKAGSALADVLDAIVGRALRVHSRRSEAQFNVLRLYETIYHRLVRSRGRLVFSDLGWLLSGRLRAANMSDEAWRERWSELRTALEFRMDARYDHWLLDEFQDTSERQWEVLEPLLEEARQDADEARSVFLVGDLKQSIYLWRQAEPELFKHVETSWAGERLKLRPLNESFRSCPQVLEMVNAIFLGANVELVTRFPGVGELWHYDEHCCSGQVAKLKGHAAMLSLPAEEDADEDAAARAVSSLIRKIDPLSRGLSCAVLVRTNKTARELSEDLRRLLGMEVICETQESVTVDNPVTLALLSLFQLAAHPGDSQAWKHLLMTPLGPELRVEKMSAGKLSARVRSAVAANGFLVVAREWAERLMIALAERDEFTERRLAQFFEVAAEFDETGVRDVDAFLRVAREHRVREDVATARAIQVMTVHQSKGLQFDVVIMPELQGDALDSVARNRLFVSRGQRGAVEWILDKPEQVVIQRDETLRKAQVQEKARQAFEGLCRLYVGVTRSKLGLYLIVDEGKRNVTNNEADVLRARLGAESPAKYPLQDETCECLWETGERDWFEMHEVLPSELAAGHLETPELGALLRQVNRTIARRTPSGEETFRIKGAELLSPKRERGRLLGTLVHELFAAVTWFDGNEKALEQRWWAAGWNRMAGYDDAVRLVLNSLRAPAIGEWFGQQQGMKREAWIERRFDMLLNDEWVSGQLDRVVLESGENGKWVGAMILDFKTDEVGDTAAMKLRAEGYKPQLVLYKEAVARLTGLAVGQIRSGLVFTARAELC